MMYKYKMLLFLLLSSFCICGCSGLSDSSSSSALVSSTASSQHASVPVDTSNLIVDPGLESGTTVYFNDGAGHFSVVKSDVRSGVYAGLIDGQGSLTQIVRGLKPNTTYTATVWIKGQTDQAIFFGAKDHGNSEVVITSRAKIYTQQTLMLTTGTHNTTVKLYVYNAQAGNKVFIDDYAMVVADSYSSISSASFSAQTSVPLSSSTVSSASSNGISSSVSVSVGASSSAIACTTDAQVKAVFGKAENKCLACHSRTTYTGAGGNLNLEMDNLGRLLLNRVTASHGTNGGQSCASEKILDALDPNNSLLIKLIDPQRLKALNQGACVRQPMPPSGASMSAMDIQCISEWAAHTANTQVPIDNEVNQPFEPSTAESALSKAKYILHGGAPTEKELELIRVSGITEGLKALVKQWESTPEYEIKIKQFVGLALQQQAPLNAKYLQQYNNLFGSTAIDGKRLSNSMSEIFTRTAWDILQNNRPFNNVVTTRKWKVTTAILVALAYADKANQTAGFAFDKLPNIADRLNRFEHFRDADYTDWRTVEFTQTNTAINYSNTATFAQQLRGLGEGESLGLKFPRVGYFNSPSFNEIWQTNTDNQFRLNAQQTIITALDKIFDPSDSTPHLTEDGIPSDHAPKPGGNSGEPESCYNCHRLMDPMRLIFANTQEISNRPKTVAETQLQASFSLGGVKKTLDSMDDFAEALAGHPQFSAAWVQKLCMWGSSIRCDAADPEFVRLEQYFKNNNYDFKALVREFIASPIFTGAQLTKTFQSKEFFVSLSRSNHVCHALRTRLWSIKKENNSTVKLPLFCDIDDDTLGIVSVDSFSRGSNKFVQSTYPGTFESNSIDIVCADKLKFIVAPGPFRVIDQKNGVDHSLAQLVQHIMALPKNHSRYDATIEALKKLYDTSRAAHGTSEKQALEDAWFAACTSPDLIGLGL